MLEKGAQPSSAIWEEESEFYVATLGGHEDIVDLLLRDFPGTNINLEAYANLKFETFDLDLSFCIILIW